jgi:hypothetical protein
MERAVVVRQHRRDLGYSFRVTGSLALAQLSLQLRLAALDLLIEVPGAPGLSGELLLKRDVIVVCSCRSRERDQSRQTRMRQMNQLVAKNFRFASPHLPAWNLLVGRRHVTHDREATGAYGGAGSRTPQR